MGFEPTDTVKRGPGIAYDRVNLACIKRNKNARHSCRKKTVPKGLCVNSPAIHRWERCGFYFRSPGRDGRKMDARNDSVVLPDSKHRLFKSFNCLQLELEVAGWFLIRALAKTKNIVFPYGFSRRWSTRILAKADRNLLDLISAKAAYAIQT